MFLFNFIKFVMLTQLAFSIANAAHWFPDDWPSSKKRKQSVYTDHRTEGESANSIQSFRFRREQDKKRKNTRDNNPIKLQELINKFTSDADSSEGSFHTITSLVELPDMLEAWIKEKNLRASEVLVNFDLDKVSVEDGSFTPFEGEKTINTYQTLIELGFKVQMLTARGDGREIDRSVLMKQKRGLKENIFDTSICFPAMHKSFTEVALPNEQIGYMYPGLSFAGRQKGDMVLNSLDQLEDGAGGKFKAVVMIDDQDSYLDTFRQAKVEEKFGRENILLVHFPDISAQYDFEVGGESMLGKAKIDIDINDVKCNKNEKSIIAMDLTTNEEL